MPNRHTHFQPIIYSIDVFLPVIELGQDQAWVPAFWDDTRPKVPLAARGNAEAAAVSAACTIRTPVERASNNRSGVSNIQKML